MKLKYKQLPFRNNVSLIVFSGKKFILVNLVNWDEDWWKFPQGGIKEDETVIQAGKREFKEEIGTDKIRVVGQSKYTNKYDWPDEVIKKKLQKYRGQFQQFLVVEFLGTEKDIVISPQEVRKYTWVTRKKILEFSADENHLLFKNYNGLIPKILEEFSL